jgi:hypothetical protein
MSRLVGAAKRTGVAAGGLPATGHVHAVMSRRWIWDAKIALERVCGGESFSKNKNKQKVK